MKKSSMKKIIWAGAFAAAAISGSAFAGPDEYVYPARVEAGEREIDFKFGTRNMKDSSQNKNASSVGLGLGVNEFWFTEVYVKFAGAPGNSTDLDAFEWENRFQLTETGKYPVDVGFLLEIERPQDRSEGMEVTWGPLFQADLGQTEWIANFLIQRNYNATSPSAASAYYRVQGRYRLSKEFSYGFQGFGDLGTWDSWASSHQQGHRFGPAVFGKIGLDGKQAIKYNAAYLIGKTRIDGDSYSGNTFRLQMEYEF